MADRVRRYDVISLIYYNFPLLPSISFDFLHFLSISSLFPHGKRSSL
ncbi:hypothetical protein KA405_05360 [Patescibacteria group bacterium]|nr:hypothetical protein [Patescibacteria group bacterium]